MALIKFQLGLAANYAALQTKDADTLYFLTDSKEIYFGEHRLGNGTVPTLIGKNLTVAGTILDLSTFLTAEEVASAISTAISAMGAVYIIKGSATVSLINALNPSATPATVKAGDVYNISDNGTISLPSGATLSNIDVRAGDNVVYTSSGWDKLAATENVDWSAILSKPTTIGGYGITDANINNGVITLGSQTITPVQAVSGKGLSTNDYTTAEKNKLAGIATGAEVNVQSDWNLTTTTADDYIKNKPSIINNTNSTSTTDVLSANIGKQLQDQITSLQAIGRFLSIWNCTTGLPESNPGSLPYSYLTGDYYIIGTTQATIVEESISIEQTVGTSDLLLSVDLETYKDYYLTITGNQYDVFVYDGTQWLKNIFTANLADFGIEVIGTPQQGDTILVTYIYPLLNYKPTGSSYNSVPSTTVETTEVQVGDVYLYDGTSWLFLLNHLRIIPIDSALDSSSTNPVENRVVAKAVAQLRDDMTSNELVMSAAINAIFPSFPSGSLKYKLVCQNGSTFWESV